MVPRSTSSASAARTAGSLRTGCWLFGLDRSPSVSRHGSETFTARSSRFPDRARQPAKDNRPEWLGIREDDFDRVAVEVLDPGDGPVLAGRGRRARRVGSELPREDHIVGREGLSVVPLDARPELPGYRPAVVGDAPVLE